MTERVEFGSKDVADSYREEYPEYLCSEDDARLLTVAFSSDVPEDVLEQARRAAADGRGERDDGPGQIPLSDHEREQIDFSKTNVPHAQSVKGIAASEGVDDWLSYYDVGLTVDEHRQVMQEAAREGRGGRRMDSEASATEKAGAAARIAESEECDHAAGHCRYGDPEACEFIEQRCGMDTDEILRQREPERPEPPDQPNPDGEEITGEAMGAIQRSWGGYHGAVDQLTDALETVRESWENAQQAAKAINSIRQSHGQEPIHFDALEAAQADQMDILRHMVADCEECHADHSEHDHDVTVSPVEDIRVTVSDGPSETPVGTSDRTKEAVLEGLAEDMEADDSEQFAQEQQGTLNVGVDAEETAEEKQVTLTGADATEENAAFPRAWNRINTGSVVRWVAGPYEIEATPSEGRVVLWGPDDLSYSIGTGIPAEQVVPLAESFAGSVRPPDVDFSSSDGTLDNAAAEAKKHALPDNTGIQQFS